ncbi:type II toxin-antitoxin system HigB family toxin [Methylobacterium nonmethylotrophicum]|uniref:Type II toxin-antitoxin system HigB family toxin n=2 Tax=Methylobacterium nonmethylotrophicum TaxID=1141884 RepID=A0A4Z0NMF0_9HYPH|nr:type II toxin-antitoxin system HigB family toxin [Methylobacterium nonmethylotrophicum]
MRVISNRTLVDFAAIHPVAAAPLQAWRKIIEANSFTSYADLKRAFNATDRVRGFYIFDIGGNKYRIITAIHFDKQRLYLRHVFTHKEYDAWNA